MEAVVAQDCFVLRVPKSKVDFGNIVIVFMIAKISNAFKKKVHAGRIGSVGRVLADIFPPKSSCKCCGDPICAWFATDIEDMNAEPTLCSCQFPAPTHLRRVMEAGPKAALVAFSCDRFHFGEYGVGELPITSDMYITGEVL